MTSRHPADRGGTTRKSSRSDRPCSIGLGQQLDDCGAQDTELTAITLLRRSLMLFLTPGFAKGTSSDGMREPTDDFRHRTPITPRPLV